MYRDRNKIAHGHWKFIAVPFLIVAILLTHRSFKIA